MHPKQSALEKRLRAMLDELDNYLEDTYGEYFDLHPNRLARGEASSTLYDGLFSASLKFTMGYGTDSGRGYSVVIDISTLIPLTGRPGLRSMKQLQRDSHSCSPGTSLNVTCVLPERDTTIRSSGTSHWEMCRTGVFRTASHSLVEAVLRNEENRFGRSPETVSAMTR